MSRRRLCRISAYEMFLVLNERRLERFSPRTKTRA